MAAWLSKLICIFLCLCLTAPVFAWPNTFPDPTVVTYGGEVVQLQGNEDVVLIANPQGRAVTVNLPASQPVGRTITIKDALGVALSANITVVPTAGTINGNPNFVLNNNYEAVVFTLANTGWNTVGIFTIPNTNGLYMNTGAFESALYNNGNSGISKIINWDNGNNQIVTITGVCTFTFIAPSHPGKFTIILKQDSTGHTFTLPTIKYPGGAPTYSSTANAIDILTVMYDGNIYYGEAAIGYI